VTRNRELDSPLEMMSQRGETPAEAWECPPVVPKHLRGKPVGEVIPLLPS